MLDAVYDSGNGWSDADGKSEIDKLSVFRDREGSLQEKLR